MSQLPRRNAALKYRADLKEQDPTIQGYIKFPATLMIERTGERKNSFEKDSEPHWQVYNFDGSSITCSFFDTFQIFCRKVEIAKDPVTCFYV